MKKLLLVFGTRPEAIKMCPLVGELRRRAGLETEVCVTGQHRGMLDQVLEIFGVVPDYDLDIMREGQSLSYVTAAVLTRLGAVLDRAKPDAVLVHGDTASAFAAALACFYRCIPVGHVEAGLRTYDLARPFPEEFDREALALLSFWHFAPTPAAARNLLREGRAASSVFVTGNTVVDAMRRTVRADFRHPDLDWAGEKRLLFVTAHRRENLGAPMRGMFRAIRRVLREHPDCRAILPLHRNPLVRRIAAEELGGCGQIRLVEPLDVLSCHNLEARCTLCLTDSGGVQEECAGLGRPTLVMRGTTERPEGVEAGILRLVGTEEESVYRHASELLDDPAAYAAMARVRCPFGDGCACERIADLLETGRCEPWTGPSESLARD